jgi:hypothetical protein
MAVQPAPIPTPPLSPGFAAMPYTPFRFTPPIPAPLPPILEAMPDVQRQYEYEEKKDKLRQKDVDRKAHKHTGLFGAIEELVESGAVMVEKGINEAANQIDTSIRSQTYEIARKNFLQYFRLDPLKEHLWREYGCRCINGSVFVHGNLYISDHYLCFLGDTRLSTLQGDEVTRLAFMIPLVNILCYQRANSLKPQNLSSAPAISLNVHPMPSQMPAEQRPDALMVYSNDGSVHSFYSFWHFEHVVNVLDHAWRSAFTLTTPPPLPLNDQPSHSSSAVGYPPGYS